jgi:branched-chain amino acid transport system ATP-binding protein
MTPQLVARDLTAGYTHAPILRGVTLEIPGGQCCGILGANGAGKTTLLRVLSGTVKVWQGAVTFGEHDITKAAPWSRVRLGLGHVPEGRRVFGPMTVEENLQVAALTAKQPREKLAEILDLFPRLAERRSQRAQTLSGGEQQMLAVGRALVTSPSLLMIDEMSAGLAPAIAEALVRELVRIRDTGISLLLVEQNPYLIADIVDRVFLLERGTIVAEGSLDELGGPEAMGEKYLGVHG